MAQNLVICGHPDYKDSVANRAILAELHRLVPEAEIIYLDELYHNKNMDAAREQKRLLAADNIIFEFPFWWYGSPSLMHRYVEEVFTHGFAYGSKGIALHGKKLILSFTTGAPESAYSPDGLQGFAMDAFLPPFLALARLTGLKYMGSVISYAMMHEGPDVNMSAIMDKAKEHAARLAAMLAS